MNRWASVLFVVASAGVLGCSTRPAAPDREPASPPSSPPAGPTPRARRPVDPNLRPAPVPEHPATVSGVAPKATNDTPAVIVLRPSVAYAYPEPATKPMMDQMARRFTPEVLVVRTGQPADFRNDDDTIHNVRVRERGHDVDDPAFNVALPQGASYDYAFDRDTIWEVKCDMHQSMSAVVVSSSSPYTAVADKDGRFEIGGLPAGAYTLIVYTGDAPVERPIQVADGQRMRVNLATTPGQRARR